MSGGGGFGGWMYGARLGGLGNGRRRGVPMILSKKHKI